MHLSFRGLGCLALLFPLLFWFAAVAVMLSLKGYQSDRIRAGAEVLQSAAAGFALGGAATWALARYRTRTKPGADAFAELPLRFWPWIWGALGAVALIASLFPAAIEFVNRHSSP